MCKQAYEQIFIYMYSADYYRSLWLITSGLQGLAGSIILGECSISCMHSRKLRAQLLVNCHAYSCVSQAQNNSTMQGMPCQLHCALTRSVHPVQLSTEAATSPGHPRCIYRSSNRLFRSKHHSRVSNAPPQLPGPSQSSKSPHFW